MGQASVRHAARLDSRLAVDAGERRVRPAGFQALHVGGQRSVLIGTATRRRQQQPLRVGRHGGRQHRLSGRPCASAGRDRDIVRQDEGWILFARARARWLRIRLVLQLGFVQLFGRADPAGSRKPAAGRIVQRTEHVRRRRQSTLYRDGNAGDSPRGRHRLARFQLPRRAEYGCVLLDGGCGFSGENRWH